MRAVVVRSYGGPEVLEVADLPEPRVGPGQLLVRVKAAPLTPVDVDIRRGELAGVLPARDHYALGRTAAGTVLRVGPGVEGYAVGDEVVGVCASLAAPSAAQAERVVFAADAAAHVPPTVSPSEAAPLPLNALTADQALDALDLSAGAHLLVTGAAGSVGGFTVELAKARGLRVTAIARPSDEELVRGLGADDFVPRGARPAPRAYDGVVDAAVLADRVVDALRDDATFVTLVLGGEPAVRRGIRVATFWAEPNGKRVAELLAMVEAGTLTSRVADLYPLDEVAAAHERFARGHVRGHLILTP